MAGTWTVGTRDPKSTRNAIAFSTLSLTMSRVSKRCVQEMYQIQLVFLLDPQEPRERICAFYSSMAEV